MIKMMLCCGGGFSSSYVAQRMQKEICQENLENEVIIKAQFNYLKQLKECKVDGVRVDAFMAYIANPPKIL